jgi:hypothetical protein
MPETLTADGGYSRTAADLPPGETPADSAVLGAETEEQDGGFTDEWILDKTRAIYTTSTDYRDTNITKQWERNLSHFRGEHAPGTRYKASDWRRSRTFRPKTRANVKAQESAFTSAAFSTISIIETKATNPADPQQVAGAAVAKELMHHRLKNTIPWFLSAVGAFQDTKNYGICASQVYWDYQTASEIKPAMNEDGSPVVEIDEATGEQIPMGEEIKKVLADKPCIDVFEPENLRFDPMADWRDPAGTSPYLIRLWPMYAGDVLERMESSDEKKRWRKYNLAEILGTRKQSADRTRQAREGRQRVDPTMAQEGDEFSVVWAHYNIVRVKGVDYIWWTLGTELILTDPVPLLEECPWLAPGERPIDIGYSSIEAHRNYPAGDVEQIAPLQEEINDLANQRLDNVKLVLNKRYFVRRGSQTDLEALMRNTPGGGVMVNDPERDIKTVDTNDVTSSSYQEHDRLDTALDELVGGFSQGSVLNNRKLNETVGGMDRMASAGGAVQDYSIIIFIETWYQPVLRKLWKLMSYYENDATVFALVAEKAKLMPRFGISAVNDALLTQNLVVEVNIGVGNTDPVNRVNRLTQGIQLAVGLPGVPERLKAQEIADDIFGALGFRDSSRYIMNDEEFKQKQANTPPAPPPPEIAVKMRELDIRQEDNKLRDERERATNAAKIELEFQKLQNAIEQRMDQMAAQLGIAQMQNKTKRDTTALQEANKVAAANLEASKPPEETPGKPPEKK